MTRTQVQQLVAVLLLVLFVGVFFLSNKTPEPGGGAVVTLPPPGESAQTPAGTPEPPAAVVPAALPDLEIPRDVFLLPTLLVQQLQRREQEEQQTELERLQQQTSKIKPVAAQQIGITNLELQGIFWGSSNPQAIINRKIVSVGDQVEDAEVAAITKESVTLSRNGQEFELKPEVLR